MFWEVWRNVASAATSSWGLGGGSANRKGRMSSSSSSSKGNKKIHRYNQLMSSSTSLSSSCATPLPKKSVSQPVNLAKCGPTNDNNGNNINDDYLIQPPENDSHISPNHGSLKNSSKSGGKGGGGGNVKHSISSFFPFNSCTFYGIMVKSKSTDCNQSKENKDRKLIMSRDNDNTKTVNNEDQSANVIEEQGKNNNNSTIDYWDEDDDAGLELPTCDVCTRAFPTIRQLAAHQRKKRHYGCIQCDSIFPSKEVLECHREQMCHYEFAIDMLDVDEQDLDDELDFFDSDTEEDYKKGIRDKDDEWVEEEMERLL